MNIASISNNVSFKERCNSATAYEEYQEQKYKNNYSNISGAELNKENDGAKDARIQDALDCLAIANNILLTIQNNNKDL